MKKFILALVALFSFTVSTSAMSYEQARQQALFLTDKMAYELNLTDDQYEAAYEVNLDYLMGVNTYDDLYGAYWRQRNMDLSYILQDWQYRTFLNASYFYRPLYWDGGYWHFRIYARYPRRDYFFFGRPQFFAAYRGGHSWRMNGGRSWYHGRDFGAPRPGGEPRMGMRDGFNRGDFGRGQSFGNLTRSNNNDRNTQFGGQQNRTNGLPQNRSFGNRQSSTRTTVTRDRQFGSQNRMQNNGQSSQSRSFNNGNQQPQRSNIFGGNRNGNSGSSNFTPRSTPSMGNNSFGGGSRSSNGGSRGGGFGGGSSRGNNGGGSFGGHR